MAQKVTSPDRLSGMSGWAIAGLETDSADPASRIGSPGLGERPARSQGSSGCSEVPLTGGRARVPAQLAWAAVQQTGKEESSELDFRIGERGSPVRTSQAGEAGSGYSHTQAGKEDSTVQ